MASLFSALFGSPVKIAIDFDKLTDRKSVAVPKDAAGKKELLPVFLGKEALSGKVTLRTEGGQKVEHVGLKLEMVGRIEFQYDSGSTYDFTSVSREIEDAGEVSGEKTFPFEFGGIDKPYESYYGANVKLRYFVRFTLQRAYSSNLTEERDFVVQNLTEEPEINSSIRLEVGIEDCLHIEFEYNKSKYHLKDIVLGKVFFLLVRIKIKHMELAIMKREYTGSAGTNQYQEVETVTKFEVMDGAPVRGESIPVRLFLGSLDLTPTYKAINNKFSVRYFLNLVLIDEEDRRYFKQQEITLWRRRL